MKQVDSIEGRYQREKPEQELRRKEVKEFWDSGVHYAEMTNFNPSTHTQTEVKHYEKASRQLRLGRYKIRFCQRKDKVYAERLEPAERGEA